MEEKQLGLYGNYDLSTIRKFLTKEVNDLLNDNIHFEKNELVSTRENYNLFDETNFDSDEQLFVIFMVENEKIEFGEGWQINETIEEIKIWENQNLLSNYLSLKAQSVINKLRHRGILDPIDTTENNNPKLCNIDNNKYRQFKTIVKKYPEKVNGLKLHFAQK